MPKPPYKYAVQHRHTKQFIDYFDSYEEAVKCVKYYHTYSYIECDIFDLELWETIGPDQHFCRLIT